MSKFPLASRAFYTQPDVPDEEKGTGESEGSKEKERFGKYGLAFDVELRGEEIVSGAQRIIDVDLLKERAQAVGATIP